MKSKLLINRKIVFILALLLLSASFTSVKAQKAYALWCTGNATLYFTYSSAELKAGVRYDNQTVTNALIAVYASDGIRGKDVVGNGDMGPADVSYINVYGEGPVPLFFKVYTGGHIWCDQHDGDVPRM